MIYSNQT